MKKAIGYTRISTEDQSNWSITGQQDIIKDYCIKNDIELVEIFTDDGKSARSFDRADWKRLEAFVKINHHQVDILLVMAWTRFSRNTKEALQMIEDLERMYNIRVVSISEPLNMHPDSPYFSYIRNLFIQNSELEFRIIRDRTRFGIYNAQKSGRHPFPAPRGYINNRDASNTPILAIDKEKSELIKDAYSRFLNGETIIAIRSILKEKGMDIKGNSDLQRILQNPLYMGYVKKISYYDEPESLIKGAHEPIVDEDTWWKVQAIFNSKKKIQRSTLSNDFPLRGVLKCFCQRNLTAAFSTGNGGKVGYYKCNSHKGTNFNSKKLHQQFDELLDEMSLPPMQIRYLQEKTLEEINFQLADQHSNVTLLQQELVAVEKKITAVEDSYFDKKVDDDTYRKWKKNYHQQRSSIQDQLQQLSQPIDQVWKKYESSLDKLASLQWCYNELEVEEKQSFIRTVFDNQLWYQGKIYRTNYLMDIFTPKALILKEKRLLIYQQPPVESGISAISAPLRSTIEPQIYRLMAIFNKVKTA